MQLYAATTILLGFLDAYFMDTVITLLMKLAFHFSFLTYDQYTSLSLLATDLLEVLNFTLPTITLSTINHRSM